VLLSVVLYRPQRGTLGKMFKGTRCNRDSDMTTLYGKRAPMKFYTGGFTRSRGREGENHIFVPMPVSLGAGAQICRIYRSDDGSDWKIEKERVRERERKRMSENCARVPSRVFAFTGKRRNGFCRPAKTREN